MSDVSLTKDEVSTAALLEQAAIDRDFIAQYQAQVAELQLKNADLEQFREWAQPQIVTHGEDQLRIAALERENAELHEKHEDVTRDRNNALKIIEKLRAENIDLQNQLCHEPSDARKKFDEPLYSEGDVMTFIGFMSGWITELNGVEMGRLQSSWDEFCKRAGLPQRSTLEPNKLYRALYAAVNDMMIVLGMHGSIDRRDDRVTHVMDALHAIDGGVYKPLETKEVLHSIDCHVFEGAKFVGGKCTCGAASNTGDHS